MFILYYMPPSDCQDGGDYDHDGDDDDGDDDDDY